MNNEHKSLKYTAFFFGVTQQTVRNWVKREWIPESVGGKYDLQEVARGIVRGYTTLINKKKGPEGVSEQDKKKEQEVRKLKLLNDEREGLLIRKAHVDRRHFEIARAVRNAVEIVPNRISAILAAETDQHIVRQLLSKELNEALNILEKETPDIADSGTN